MWALERLLENNTWHKWRKKGGGIHTFDIWNTCSGGFMRGYAIYALTLYRDRVINMLTLDDPPRP